jgi:branched-chain amino acid transport system substrate-binding protein
MAISQRRWSIDRRTILKSSAAIAAAQFSSPFIIKARGETPVKIGLVDPLTGVYAAIAQNEVVGAKYAAFWAGRSNFWSRTRPTTSAPACRKRAS